MTADSANPIHQLEILPVWLANRLWSVQLKQRCGLTFVDNDGAKASLVSGYSHNQLSVRIVNGIGDQCIQMSAYPWYDRVPSPSNPADSPSRGGEPPGLHGWPAASETEVPEGQEMVAMCLLAAHLETGVQPAAG